jgi:CcmD family protein
MSTGFGMGYLVAAYAAVWVMLFLYLFSLSRRQSKIDREIAALRKLLDEKK